MNKLLPILLLFSLLACQPESDPTPLFTNLPNSYTGIDFSNDLTYSDDFNPYIFKNFFNGGGVAIGDINNDGLADLFFCGNMVDNKLYLNRGNFKFEDITEKAKVASKNVWSSGVSFVDVNGDGWLDMYVCKSGKPGGELRYNELFINNGQPDENGIIQFLEQAKDYGIADEGLSAHAAFFDYDKDGDLDMYLLNNSLRPVGGFDIRPGLREIPDPYGGNKFYRNDYPQKKFTDITQEAGIYSSNIGYGLGVTIGDVDKDGWQDIHISNDFFERDYLYINQQDGTFKEDLVKQIREISAGSMGADMADINNDGYPEIFVTDMLPESEARYKTKMTFENWSKYQLNVQNGYHHQFTRNVLQLNNKNGSFSEIGRLAGVHATDWSWSALLADFDNDGWKDIYVTNGIYQDLLDQDYINFYSNDPKIIGAIRNREEGAILKLLEKMPSEKIPNYAFKNNKDLTFSKVATAWGLATPSFSNGAAYGDLDNDGDLDLVVNNCNMPAFVYRNEAEQLLGNSYLAIQLKGDRANPFALGTQVTLTVGDTTFYQELVTSKGFQSSIDYTLLFGLGNSASVDKLEIQWTSGKVSTLSNVPINQKLVLEEKSAGTMVVEKVENSPKEPPSLFQKIEDTKGLNFQHQENKYSDFDRDRLLFQMISSEGPKLAVGDVNADGRKDIFIGGAAGQVASLFIQNEQSTFNKSNQQLWEQQKHSEDTDALFFDADGDGDQDLYVARGSNEFSSISPALIDHLYFNDGVGDFTKAPTNFPIQKIESTSCVRASDFDGDGDLDLFVGVRLKPKVYGVPVSSYLLENDGQGKFKDNTQKIAPDLKGIGMVTDALWIDYDKDEDEDLIVVGEWMPITIFENSNGKLTENSKFQIPNSNGLWNCIKAGDFNEDGYLDFVIGNHGWNSRLKASTEKPLSLYVNDYDGNKTAEQILTTYNGDQAYPLALRHDLVMQLPSLKKKYLRYEDYQLQSIDDLFSEKQVRTSARSQVYTTASSIAINKGNGQFDLQPLPVAAQLAPMYALLIKDVNKDQHLDILMGGNFYRSKPEVGIYDGSQGVLLVGDGVGGFTNVPATSSGFLVLGEIRDIEQLEELIVVARNNDALQIFKGF